MGTIQLKGEMQHMVCLDIMVNNLFNSFLSTDIYGSCVSGFQLKYMMVVLPQLMLLCWKYDRVPPKVPIDYKCVYA